MKIRYFCQEIYSVLIKYSEVDIIDYVKSKEISKSDSSLQNYISLELKKPKLRLELSNAIKNKIIIVSDYLMTLDLLLMQIE